MFRGLDAAASPMTATIATYETFFWHGNSWVKEQLQQRLGYIIDIINVERPFLSNRFVITFTPKTTMTNEQWSSAFTAAFQDMGYKQSSTLEVVGGTISTQPGGLTQATTEVARTAGASLWTGLTPVIILGGIVLAIMYLPRRG